MLSKSSSFKSSKFFLFFENIFSLKCFIFNFSKIFLLSIYHKINILINLLLKKFSAESEEEEQKMFQNENLTEK